MQNDNALSDIAVRGAVGLVVLAALFVTIWAARDSSARVGPPRHAEQAVPAHIQSARTDRGTVTRTAITPEQRRALERPASE